MKINLFWHAGIVIVLVSLSLALGSKFMASSENNLTTGDVPGSYLPYVANFELVLMEQTHDDLGDYFAEDWMLHDSQYDHRYVEAGYHDWVDWYHALMPSDFEYVVEGREIIDNMYAVVWTISGTHTGEVDGILATGNTIRLRGVLLHRFEGNQLVESWIQYNEQRFLVQIGIEETMESDCERDIRWDSCA